MIPTIRRASTLAAAILLVTGIASLRAEDGAGAPVVPVLRASVTVATDIVRIGDFVDNAGAAASIPLFRAPDIGTTGSVPAAQIVAALRAHQVIGVDTHDIEDVAVTRTARTFATAEIERLVAQALARQNGLGDAESLTLAFDRGLRTLHLDPAIHGEPQAVYAKYDPRTARFDVLFEVATAHSAAPARLRFTGTALETVEVAIITRSVERGEVLKASDVSLQRRPKAEAVGDIAAANRAIGMASRRALRANQILKYTDLAKPEIVQRDQNVTLIYDAPGIHLTMMGKATESGAEGDVVSVMNVQSKRVVQGVVSGPGRITLNPPRTTTTAALTTSEPAAPVRAAE